MKSWIEKVILAVLVVALVLAVIGLLASVKVLFTIALILLIAVSAVFGALQVASYLSAMGKPDEKQQLIMMIISIVVCLTIIVLSIFTFAGKLFSIY